MKNRLYLLAIAIFLTFSFSFGGEKAACYEGPAIDKSTVDWDDPQVKQSILQKCIKGAGSVELGNNQVATCLLAYYLPIKEQKVQRCTQGVGCYPYTMVQGKTAVQQCESVCGNRYIDEQSCKGYCQNAGKKSECKWVADNTYANECLKCSSSIPGYCRVGWQNLLKMKAAERNKCYKLLDDERNCRDRLCYKQTKVCTNTIDNSLKTSCIEQCKRKTLLCAAVKA